MKIIYSLITMLMLSAPALNADVIIGDAAFYDNWLGTSLYTVSMEGGLSIITDDQGGGDYNFHNGHIAIAYRLYDAYPSMEFTSSYVAMQPPLVSNEGIDHSESLQSFLLGETKYYAYWEDVFPYGIADEVDNADNYGWVSLTYNGSGLIVTDSATALGGGIIVGTYTQIPEPATVLLFGLGGFGAWLLRRNKQHQDELE